MKRLTALILVWMLLFVPSAFSESSAGIDLAALEHDMCLDCLLEICEGVQTSLVYYDDAEEELFSTSLHASRDENGEIRIVYEDSEGNIEILTRGRCAGYDAWSMKEYVSEFVMNEYENSISDMERSFFRSEQPSEKFVEARREGDKVILITRTDVSDDERDGYQLVEYTLGGERMLLEEYREYFVPYEGEKQLSLAGRVTLDAAYEADEALMKLFSPEETRSVFVVVKGENEQVLEYEVPSDVDMLLVYPAEYMLYEDAEGKRMYTGAKKDENGLYPDELTLYLVKLG